MGDLSDAWGIPREVWQVGIHQCFSSLIRWVRIDEVWEIYQDGEMYKDC